MQTARGGRAPWMKRADTAEAVAAGRRRAAHSAVLSMPPLRLITPAERMRTIQAVSDARVLGDEGTKQGGKQVPNLKGNGEVGGGAAVVGEWAPATTSG